MYAERIVLNLYRAYADITGGVRRHRRRPRRPSADLGPAKGKDTATTLGPWLVTADELAPYRAGTSFDLGMSVCVNDVLLGTDRLSNMAWSFAEMVAYASRGTWVRPGDVLGSGTCGNGCLAELWGRRGRDTAPPLRPGDVVTMTAEGLGAIRNRVVPGVEPHVIPPRHPGTIPPVEALIPTGGLNPGAGYECDPPLSEIRFSRHECGWLSSVALSGRSGTSTC